jgi:hypothetical protein
MPDPITDQTPEKILQDRLRRALRWHGQYYLWKPRRRSDWKYWVICNNTCVDGADRIEDLLERWGRECTPNYVG